MIKKNKTSFFKLDSNVDGVYIDGKNNVVTIPNMIQVVAASDGVAAFPLNPTGGFEIDEIEGLQATLTTNINTSGHGLIYNEKGEVVAQKGDLIFRDGAGNFTTLNNMITKVNSIQEQGDETRLRDLSIQAYNTSDYGVTLEEMINTLYKKSNIIGFGNMSFAARSEDYNVDTVTMFTSKLTEANNVWIAASATVNTDTHIQLVHVGSGAVLNESVVTCVDGRIMPVYCDYVGTLSITEATSSVYTCPSYIWNSYLKKFYKGSNSATTTIKGVEEISLVVISGGPIIAGSINLVCSDNFSTGNVYLSGTELLVDQSEFDVTFDTTMPSTNYSLTIQLNEMLQTWYANKSTTGFTVKIERPYSGSLDWFAIHDQGAENISSVYGGYA